MDLNRRFSDNESCWLIKVDTRISGPWTFNEVLDQLSRGELKTFHEAQSPMDRWRPLQGQPLFSAAIERLKKQNAIEQEETFTRTERTSFTRTIDLSLDRTQTMPGETITPPPVFKEENTPPPQPAMPHQPYKQVPIFYKKKQKSHWPIWAGVTIVTVIIFGVLLSPSKKKQVAAVKNQFLDYVDHGLAYRKRGDWYEALRSFKKAYQMNNKDVDLVFEMAPLLVQLENQTMYTRGIIEKVMHGQYKKENLTLGKNILGLTFSYEGQYKPATKLFDEVLKEDDTFFPALVNKGFALYLSSKFGEGEEALTQALQNQNTSAIPYLYLLENYVLGGARAKNAVMLEKGYQFAGQIVDRFYDGRQEMLFLQTYAAFKISKDEQTLQALVHQTVDIDPDLTVDHLHSPLLDWRGLQWSQFSGPCAEIYRPMKSELSSMLEFVCIYKNSNEIAAQQMVSGWMSKAPKSLLPHLAQAMISAKLGEYEKARVSLGLAKKVTGYDKLLYSVTLKVCSRLQDVACLRNNAESFAKISPLHAFAAKAIEGKLAGGDNKQAVYSGLRESSNYIPLINLQ